MQPYLNSWEVIKCPSDTQSCRIPINNSGKFFRSYGLTYNTSWWHQGPWSNGGDPAGNTCLFFTAPRYTDFTQPSLTVLAGETVESLSPSAGGNLASQISYWNIGALIQNLGPSMQWRHCENTRVNVSYLDGHVQAVYGRIFPGTNNSVVPQFPGYRSSYLWPCSYYGTDGEYIGGLWGVTCSIVGSYDWPWPGR